MKSSICCDHANECPQACPCELDCSCRAGMCREQPAQHERDPETRIAYAAKRLSLTVEQVRILLHTIGIQHRAGKWSPGGWRNRYRLDAEICDSFDDCMTLVEGGWMKQRVVPDDLGGGFVFYVTEAGGHAIRALGWEVAT